MKGLKIPAALVLMLLLGTQSRAQDKMQMPHFGQINRTGNVRDQSLNPTWISDNPLGDMTEISAGYGLDRGDFHDLDESSRSRNFELSIDGHHRFGKVDCFGILTYRNSMDRQRRWNSTMYISEGNPFILADSIMSDFGREEFDLKAGVSWRPVKALAAGIAARYLTGSQSNQTDPRPRTDAMHFSINPGITAYFGGRFTAGATADIDLLRESISHGIINTQMAYLYFRFKGMGDNSTYSSNRSLSYPRNYKGQSCKAAVHFSGRSPSGSVADFIEIYYLSGKETARDGGRSFTFLGGDYSQTGYGLRNRFTANGRHTVHSITLQADYRKDNGVWYDQQEKLDPDHNNALYYEVLNTSTINVGTELSAGAEYSMDILSADGLPWLGWFVSGRAQSSKTLHYEGDGAIQKYTRAVAAAGLTKYIHMSRCLLDVSLSGRYAMPLSRSLIADGLRLADIYTAPRFEYASCSMAGAMIDLSARFPVNFSGFKTWIGVQARAGMDMYTGDSRFSKTLQNTSAGHFRLGVNLMF